MLNLGKAPVMRTVRDGIDVAACSVSEGELSPVATGPVGQR